MRIEALYGRDWTNLGVIGRADLSAEVALANSRGGVAKGYRYTDPNEDVVAAASLDDGRVVLICADGHNGEPASRVAVDTMLELSPRLGDSDALLDAFVVCNDAVLRVNAGSRNRTTLIVTVVDGERVHWAAMGDSALVVLRSGRAPVRLGDAAGTVPTSR
jgi:serine/threonine protein phosphatase PrpC